MRRSSLALAMAAALVLVISAAASARSLDITPVVFTDPVGDSATAPDIASVAVTNDAQGTYGFNVTFATPLNSSSVVDLFLDTDLNPATGDPKSAGADFVLEDVESDNSFGFYKWDGTTFSGVQPVAIKVTGSADFKSLQFIVGASDIGATPGFNFFVESSNTGSSTDVDDAPSGAAVWQYMLQKALTLSPLTAKASAAKAGGTWVLVFAARRSDTGSTVGSEGAITCKATSGSMKLVLVSRAFISSGGGLASAAVCAFKIPKKLKHKTLHGTITVSVGSVSLTQTFTKKVT